MTIDFGTADTGMEVYDLHNDSRFRSFLPHLHDPARQVEALSRLARIFAKSPQTILQELVEIAIDLCGADSAGISLEELGEAGDPVFRWIATGGKFKDFVNGTTPRFYSPCGTCLDRGRPQLFRVTKPYYDALGIEADPVTDGVLIPWQADDMRGTIWVVAHERVNAFDSEDFKMMESLADFSSIAVRHQHQQRLLIKNATAAAAAGMANELAHRINNPLQSLTNTVYLVGQGGEHANEYLKQATLEIATLSQLVKRLLAVSGMYPPQESAREAEAEAPSLNPSQIM